MFFTQLYIMATTRVSTSQLWYVRRILTPDSNLIVRWLTSYDIFPGGEGDMAWALTYKAIVHA